VEIHVLWAPRCVISRAVLSQYMPPITHALKARLRHAFSDTAAVAARTASHICKRVKVNHGLLFATRIGIIHPSMVSSSSKLLPYVFCSTGLKNQLPPPPPLIDSNSRRCLWLWLARMTPTTWCSADPQNHRHHCRHYHLCYQRLRLLTTSFVPLREGHKNKLVWLV
jgi:hypothetical protein